jgi:hypothetical protein
MRYPKSQASISPVTLRIHAHTINHRAEFVAATGEMCEISSDYFTGFTEIMCSYYRIRSGSTLVSQ